MLDFELSFRSAFVILRVGQGSLGRARRVLSCAAGHETSKLEVDASYTRPKNVGMLSSAISALKRA